MFVFVQTCVPRMTPFKLQMNDHCMKSQYFIFYDNNDEFDMNNK